MTPITSMINLGQKSAKWLAAIGIHTAEDLQSYGVVKAYCELKKSYPDRVNVNLLFSLQGALLRTPWNLLPEAMKEDLQRQVTDLEQHSEPE